jgi:hypothetical protein
LGLLNTSIKWYLFTAIGIYRATSQHLGLRVARKDPIAEMTALLGREMVVSNSRALAFADSAS